MAQSEESLIRGPAEDEASYCSKHVASIGSSDSRSSSAIPQAVHSHRILRRSLRLTVPLHATHPLLCHIDVDTQSTHPPSGRADGGKKDATTHSALLHTPPAPAPAPLHLLPDASRGHHWLLGLCGLPLLCTQALERLQLHVAAAYDACHAVRARRRCIHSEYMYG